MPGPRMRRLLSRVSRAPRRSVVATRAGRSTAGWNIISSVNDGELNPQGQQMADESMVRTLAAQAEAIWPQEAPLIRRYGLPDDIRILDAGCGTGEITFRLAELFPRAEVTGVDIIDEHIARAGERCLPFGPRVRFENRSVYALGEPDGIFDLTVCRHVLQATPYPERVIAELLRVTRPGGRLHLVAEDYGMLHFAARRLDPDDFWRVVPKRFGASTNTDLFIGRNVFRHLRKLGAREIAIDFVVVDPLRVRRATFAALLRAWSDGFADAIAEHTPMSASDARAHFEDMIATLRDPDGYGVWLVPVVSAVRP